MTNSKGVHHHPGLGGTGDQTQGLMSVRRGLCQRVTFPALRSFGPSFYAIPQQAHGLGLIPFAFATPFFSPHTVRASHLLVPTLKRWLVLAYRGETADPLIWI